MKKAKFQVYRGENGLWYWRLKASNGEIIAQSEGYATKASAHRGTSDVAYAAVEAAGLNLWNGKT